MTLDLWEAALGAAGAAGAAFFTRRSRGERDASSAVELAKAYGELVDDLRASVGESREHIRRQDHELAELRREVGRLRHARDEEVNSLRTELAAVRTELADSRTENTQLRDRIANLEARERPQGDTP